MAIDITSKDYVDTELLKKQNVALIKMITAHQTVNTYEVPTLSVQDVQDIYNSIVAGRTAIIQFDPSGYGIDAHFQVIATTNMNGISIRFIYNDIMVLTYTISDNTVIIDYKVLPQAVEEGTFTLEDDSTVTKNVCIK